VRFVLAIITFVIATTLIGVGVAQRTFLLPPGAVVSSNAAPVTDAYAVIDSETLLAHTGSQTLSLAGSGKVFFAYGQTADVDAWVQGSTFTKLSFDEESGALVSTGVPADPAGAANVASGSPNPTGSDLWLDEFSADGGMSRTVNLPAGYSIIIASDGAAVAPAAIALSWPIDNSTPWAIPLLLTGTFVLLVGLALLLWGLWHMKRQQGPRRKPPGAITGKRFSFSRTLSIESGVRRGRRGISQSVVIVVPLAIITALLAGSGAATAATPTPSPSPLPTSTATPTPTPSPPSDAPTPTPTAGSSSDVPLPVVTEAQAKMIIDRVTSVVTAADAASNSDLLATRFAGPAFDLRTVTYTIRAAYPEYPAAAAIAPGPASVVLPQATKSWPKVLLAVVTNPDATIAPQSLTLVQETPRSNYKANYAIALEPDTTLPPVAAATVGTARLAPDSKLLQISPTALKEAYADILAVGSESPFFGLVDPTGDSLRTQVGADYKATAKAGLPSAGTVDFAKVPGIGDAIALATIDSGALVNFELRETVTGRPVTAGGMIETTGAIKSLSGIASSGTGVEATYAYQLLFYIPPAGSTDLPKLLGFSQGLVQAKEIP
jgi:hypothetical protein